MYFNDSTLLTYVDYIVVIIPTRCFIQASDGSGGCEDHGEECGLVLTQVRGPDLKESCVKFLLLDASSRFAEVRCRANHVPAMGCDVLHGCHA